MNRDLVPLPVWMRWWKSSADRRRRAAVAFGSGVSWLVALAVSSAGAILIAYGVWLVFRPAGFVVGGGMVWLLQWSREKDKERR